jgi:hypothetical protein
MRDLVSITQRQLIRLVGDPFAGVAQRLLQAGDLAARLDNTERDLGGRALGAERELEIQA